MHVEEFFFKQTEKKRQTSDSVLMQRPKAAWRKMNLKKKLKPFKTDADLSAPEKSARLKIWREKKQSGVISSTDQSIMAKAENFFNWILSIWRIIRTTCVRL